MIRLHHVAPLLAGLAVVAAGCAVAPPPVSVSAQGLTAWLDPATRTLTVMDATEGIVLERGIVQARAGGRDVASDDPALRPQVTADAATGELTIALDKALALKVALPERQVQVRVEGDLQGPATFRARAGVGPGALIAMLKDDAPADRGVLVTTLGPATVPGATALFDPQRDLALSAGPADAVRWTRDAAGWEVRATANPAPASATAPGSAAPLLTLRLHPHYYRDELGIQHYAPLPRLPRWPTAPVVAMTWYGIEAMKGRPAQTKERLFPQIDWVAQHLKPYVGDNLVFQLDDNYPETDDQLMRELAAYIRGQGLVPGIWFTPYVVAPKSEAEAHPEWFLHDPAGKTIPTFGGISYGGATQHGTATLNVRSRAGVDQWYGMWWKKASETWDYDFFKIDGQPDVVNAYRKATDGGGIDGYREGLRLGRAIVGPAKFINACWGTPVEAIGLVNGSRTGPDTGYDSHATRVVLEWNFLNNVAWWSDPDAAASLYKATVERTRLNAQARALTGQQFLTDDLWTQVPPEIAYVWQRCFPTLDIHPVNLYRITKDWARYDLFDLRVAKPWGAWDVVGLFNYEGHPADKVLDLARLPLEAPQVHVYEYWSGTYLGQFERTAKLPVSCAACEGKLYAIVPAEPAGSDRPVLLSTSRHVSQGGLDLEQVSWKQDGARWVVSGQSSHLVKGDAYELAFAAGRYTVAAAMSVAGPVRTTRAGGVTRVAWLPETSGNVNWQIAFAPATGPGVDVVPAELDVTPGAAGQVKLTNLGPAPVRLRVRMGDPHVRLTGVPEELAPRPAATVQVEADSAGLAPGQTLVVPVTVEVEGAPALTQQVLVRVHAPRPENLARRAKATASSTWGAGYEAGKVSDGDSTTRWNSGPGDARGSWIDLTWDQPVKFDRVVIDECTDYGERIEKWQLLAGDQDLKPIAQGAKLGRDHTVTLPSPIEAKRLRLLIENATAVPTIWEIEVQNTKKP